MTPRTERKVSRVAKQTRPERELIFLLWQWQFLFFNCQTDWFNTHGDNAINHFGRVEQPIVLTEANAWQTVYGIEHVGIEL